MRISIIVLFSGVFILLHGVSCRLFAENVVEAVDLLASHSKIIGDYKRQASDECVVGKLDSLDIDQECVMTALLLEEDNETIAQSQPTFNTLFSVVCEPECGNAILDAFIDCGTFDEMPSAIDFFAGLCATNENGEKCYERFLSAWSHVESEVDCYDNYLSNGTCTCAAELREAVGLQGCCLETYHNFIRDTLDALDYDIDYQPQGLYEDCDVNLPGGCNNSPISSSSPSPSSDPSPSPGSNPSPSPSPSLSPSPSSPTSSSVPLVSTITAMIAALIPSIRMMLG